MRTPRQVLPECSGSTQNQPCDGSGSPFGAGASGVLHSTRIFPAPAPDFFWCCTRFLFEEKTKWVLEISVLIMSVMKQHY